MDVAKVELGLASDELDPVRVTDVVGIVPSRQWRKGEAYSTRAGERRHPWGIWVITCEDSEVERAVLALLSIVEAKQDGIRVAAREFSARLSVSIWWEPEGGQGGFSIGTDAMRRLCALADRLDVYFPG